MKNKDNIKPILDKYNLKIKDSWTTQHLYPGMKTFICYYYTFVINNNEYCVSGDSKSYILSTIVRNIYMGYSLSELEKAIQNIAQAS